MNTNVSRASQTTFSKKLIFGLSLAVIFLIATVFLSVSKAETSGWTAYNDAGGPSSASSTGNVTNIGYPQSPGNLIKYSDGSDTGVTLTFSYADGLEYYAADEHHPDPYIATSTDGYNEFVPIINLGSASQNRYGNVATATFSGLSGAYTYTLVALGERGNSGYAYRYSKYTISDVTSFTNSSSVGAEIATTTLPGDSTYYCAGDNFDNGYVAKWTNIVPVGDTITLAIESVDSSGTPASSTAYLNALKLEATPVSALTITFDKNGGDTEASPASTTVNYGATTTLPMAPTKVGYTFAGWNTLANGSGTAFTSTTTVTADLTVYAEWAAVFCGGDGSTSTPYQICNWTQLDQVRNYLSSNFILDNDLSTSTSGYLGLGSDWTPIGTLSGNFNGNNNTISDLTINLSSTTDNVGLFSYTAGDISNIELTNIAITGGYRVGGLVGWQDSGTIYNSHSTGSVSGSENVGGLVGAQFGGTISDSSSSGNVSCSGPVVGGLVGYQVGGTISDSFSTGNISGSDYVGGLVGTQSGGTISSSYSTGTTTGSGVWAGGLVGEQLAGGTISNSYSIGNVTGNSTVGGLIGDSGGTISNSYSTGSVTGNYGVGGLVAYYSGTTTNSYWDIETSGQSSSGSGTGTTTAAMKTPITFSGWDKGSNTADLNDGYPYLGWQIDSTSSVWFFPNYNLTYIAGTGGVITGSSTQVVNYGASGSAVTASSSLDYRFTAWSDGTTTNPRTDTNVTSNISVTADFVSTDATLSDLTISSGTLTPAFSSSTLSYTDSVGHSIGSVTVTPTANRTSSTITVNGSPVTSGSPSGSISLTVGSNTITIVVTAEDDTVSTSTIEVTRAASSGGGGGPPLPTCIYDNPNWSACSSGFQSRTLTAQNLSCIGETIKTETQSCTATTTATTTPEEATTTASTTEPTATTTPCTAFTYSDWSACINDTQDRTTLTAIPTDCVGGASPINFQACTVATTTLPFGTTTPGETPTTTPLEGGEITDNTANELGDNTQTNGTGNGLVDNLVSALNIGAFITDNVSALGSTTERIVLEAQKIVASPTGSAVTKTITTAGVVTGGIAVSGVLALNSTAVADLLFLPFKLWALLLSFLGLKKRNRPWGTIYDSVTKQPIDPAYVTLKKLNSKEETTSITDLDGRYGFLISPGKYTLTANKTNYTFPSQKITGQKEDILYNNLYFGEEINIDTAGAVINKNIPLDPVKFDWNEFVKGEKKLMKFYSKRDKIMRIVTDWMFRVGFVVSVLSLFLVTVPYNIIIFGLYVLLTLLRKYGLKQKASGALTEKNGNPLSFAIIRILSPDLNMEITNKVADKIGRYYCLVPKGKYQVKIEKKNDDESYSEVYTSEVLEAKNGIINKNFII